VVRPSNFFGVPEDLAACNRWTLTPLAFCRDAVERGRIVLNTPGHQRRNFIGIRDLCQVIQAADSGRPDSRLIHAAGQETLSIRELAFLVRDAFRNLTGRTIEVQLPEGVAQEEPFVFLSRFQADLPQPREHLAAFLSSLLQAMLP
jgi:UDP-glucose 4-epimerase